MAIMKYERLIAPLFAACVGVMALNGLINQASAECFSASGKITNKALPTGSTLGVVALQLGENKFKCGIMGLPQPQSSGFNFKHTVVCDDLAAPDEAQAQVTFNTFFAAPLSNVAQCPAGSPGGPASFSFLETSIPDPATPARGAFSHISENGSTLTINGHYNCNGGIVMTFSGQLCFAD